MRTTMEIPDSLLSRAKASAAARGIWFSQWGTEALRESLAAPQGKAKKPPIKQVRKLRGRRLV